MCVILWLPWWKKLYADRTNSQALKPSEYAVFLSRLLKRFRGWDFSQKVKSNFVCKQRSESIKMKKDGESKLTWEWNYKKVSKEIAHNNPCYIWQTNRTDWLPTKSALGLTPNKLWKLNWNIINFIETILDFFIPKHIEEDGRFSIIMITKKTHSLFLMVDSNSTYPYVLLPWQHEG